MKRIVLFVLLGASTLAAQSNLPPVQPSNAAVQHATSPSWIDSYRNATISFGRIAQDHGQASFQVVGTGIFIATVKNGESHLFLLTAKHMFYDPSKSWHPATLQVRLASEENESLTAQLGVGVKLQSGTGADLWLSPPDGADVAALPIALNQFQQLAAHDGHLSAIPLSSLADPDDVYDGASIFVLGYPAVVGNSRLVRAILRGGCIAWTDPADPSTHPFLIDATILPGNSGGPVIKLPNGLTRDGHSIMGDSPKLLGIVSQDITQRYAVTADGRVVTVQPSPTSSPSVAEVQVTGVGAIGKVEPGPEIKQFLMSIIH